MSSHISRRSLAKGVAGATPAVMATAAVPAYASWPKDYTFTASWFSEYETFNNGQCDIGSGYVDYFTFYTDASFNGEAPGFGVTELNNSPTTGVTLNNVQMQVAFPTNLITRLTVVQGDYTVSGPTTITMPGAPYNQYDVFTFTFTGQNTGTTSPTNTTWPGSNL